MKKLLTLCVAGALLAALSLSSCSKEGATGPTGLTGATGPTGASGTTAKAYTGIVQPSQWVSVGTSGTAGARVYFQFNDPDFAYNAVNSGAVLVYEYGITNLGVRSYNALTWTHFNGAGTEFTSEYNWNDGAVVVDEYNSNHTFTTFSIPDTFKIVVIPGTGKTSWPVNLNDYEAVKAYFHIKD